MKALRYIAYVVAIFAMSASGAWFWALHTTSGARWILGQVESVTGLHAASIEGDIAGGLDLRELRFATDSVQVEVAQLALAVDIDVLPLSVEVVAARAATVAVVVHESAGPEKPARDLAQVLNSLVLPVPLRVAGLHVEQLSISTADVEEQIDALDLVASWHETVVVERLGVSREGLSAGLDGTLDLGGQNQFTLNASTLLPAELTRLTEPMALKLSGSGDPSGVDYEASLGSIATANGSIRWQGELEVLIAIVLDGLDLSDMVSDWPAGFPLHGRVNASLDEERLAVTDSVLEIRDVEGRLQVDAAFDRATEEISGHLRWQALRWPLPRHEARVHSESADLRIRGTPDNWTVEGSIALLTDEFPEGRFVVAGAGTRDGVRGRILESELLGGYASGEAAYSWRGARAWSANLEVRNVRLDAFLPEWPAVVTGRVEGRGTSEPFALHAALHNVAGEVRGLDILANGVVEFGDDGFVARNVNLEHGESRLRLDGALLQSHGVSFDAVIADAGLYNDAVVGEARVKGRVSMVDSLIDINTLLESPLLSIGGRELTDVALELQASAAGQSLAVTGTHLDTDFAVSIDGAFDDWSAPLDSRFTGAVRSFKIDLGDEHALVLRSEAPLALSLDEASLQAFCITDQTGASLCSSADWEHGGDYSITLQLEDVPLVILEHVVDTGLRFDQLVGGNFTWHHDESGTGGSGSFRVSAGTVSTFDDPDSKVATGEGRVDFQIQNAQLLSGDLELPLPKRGHITGNFALLDVTQTGSSEVTGNLNVDIYDIRVLSRLSPYLDSASGTLRANLAISGKVTEPQVTGNLVVEDGRFVYLPIGLDVEDVNLTGSVDSEKRFDLSGTFRAGEGYAEIMSRADYSDAEKPGLHFSMRGTNLTLVEVPDVVIRIDPDIDVTLSRETLTINGEVTVPHALIKPASLGTARINESEDVVIVAGELPDQPDEEQANNGLDYQGELRVVLGNDIVIDLDVAKANITGAAAFDWQGDVIPIADGRYRIGGNIAAFGQVLEIEEGLAHFPKVPADQPHIRIRAEREIFGNTAVKRAGVLIDGPVRRPTVEAYTLPLTTEERALTLLVTGSDFDYEQGVGAVDFGTYIAPRLFVSYGVGVFERENIISARFDLARGFGIKASSGSKESGIDLNYRFEN